jgi:hypothetical protein
MNNSNKSNSSDPGGFGGFYLSEDQWLTMFGSVWSLDIFTFYPYIVAGILGLILNAYSLVIFQDTEFNIPLYKYLRVYCATNMAVCLIGTGNCFSGTKRLFPWSNSYYTGAYAAFFATPMVSVLSFFGSMIDIFILLDRIGNFNKRVQTWIKLPVYKTCVITFITCFLFNIPFFLNYCPASLTVMLNATTPFTIWYGAATPYFTQLLIGTVWMAFYLVVRDFGIMVAQLVLNLVSIVLLKRYLEKKKSQFQTASTVQPSVLPNNRVSAAVSHTAGHSLNESNSNKMASVVNNNNSVVATGDASVKSGVQKRRPKKEKISSADQKATVRGFL